MRGLVLTGVVLAAAVAGCGADPKAARREKMLAAQVDAEGAIRAASRDPASVAFRHEVVILHQRGAVVCGEVNGRNGFGGMTGFTRFISVNAKYQLDDGLAEFQSFWTEACMPGHA